jgi:hypothetical protein
MLFLLHVQLDGVKKDRVDSYNDTMLIVSRAPRLIS